MDNFRELIKLLWLFSSTTVQTFSKVFFTCC